jgi:hypothetical protein
MMMNFGGEVGDEKKLDWLIGRMTSTTAKGTCED